MSVTDIINLLLSIVTVFIAAFALWQTNRQIRLSNKQKLFDRRLEKYIIAKNLVELYKNNKNGISEEIMCEMPEILFAALTNCAQLEDMANVMNNPLGQSEKRSFLNKCEWLKMTSEEIKLIWNNEASKMFSEFINEYSLLLRCLHKQKIFVDGCKSNNKPMPLDVYQKKINENAENISLFKTEEKLKSYYEEIIETNAELELANSLKLK